MIRVHMLARWDFRMPQELFQTVLLSLSQAQPWAVSVDWRFVSGGFWRQNLGNDQKRYSWNELTWIVLLSRSNSTGLQRNGWSQLNMNHENQNLFFLWFNLGLYRGKKFQSWYLIYIYIHTMIFDMYIYIYTYIYIYAIYIYVHIHIMSIKYYQPVLFCFGFFAVDSRSLCFLKPAPPPCAQSSASWALNMLGYPPVIKHSKLSNPRTRHGGF